MCGITGKLSWNSPPTPQLIKSMNDALIHRGPDAEGVYINGSLGLGHRRLSIIDLSESGNQPMSDTSGLFWIVFNGEIYNYQEIRSTLQRLGTSFRTQTDTEVILEAYKQWGVECLQRFNGMFAFALWSEPHQTLFLARDRLGEKPLFYYPLPDGGVVFASELKSLLKDEIISRQINLTAISHYLSLGYLLTSESIVQGVKKLAAAHYLIVRQSSSFHETRYWNLITAFQNKNSFVSQVEAGEAFNSLLEDSVRLRMVADVSLGSFLSGGIDSSSIVSAMCRLSPSVQHRTFSIGFLEASYNELPEARAVANLLNVNHTDQLVNADALSLLAKIAWHADEPFADTSIIPMYFLAALARKHVTVCLSGDGADEILAGYETYVADKLHYLTCWLPQFFTGALARVSNHLVPVTFNKVSFDYKLKQFLAGYQYNSLSKAHYFWRTLFSESEKRSTLPDLSKVFSSSNPYTCFHQYWQEAENCHYLDRAMYVDIKTWLADDILVKVDRSTMAHSLETRTPFLDHRLVEFSASLPVEMKLKGLQTKYLLKQSQSAHLPKATLRRSKKGFNAPVSHWILSEQKNYFTSNLFNGNGMINQNFVHELLDSHIDKKQDNSLKLFALANLNLSLGTQQLRFS
ncbi:MAG: asparagine synthase (glutamine-hydrolyzing) [Spirulinaceae cyanobacterium SM2_1_0]|nr:asparagine synthase (glutamine-hydrolyzing) [Spirulinaceae cyanobacterium SM2_1_0]